MEHLPFLVVHGRAVWIAALVVLALAGSVWGLVRVARLRRRDAARARRNLGDPVGSIEGVDDGAVVTVAGGLQAEESCERFVDGAPAAATTLDLLVSDPGPERASQFSARAGRLSIETRAGRVGVAGRVSIVAGRHGRASFGGFDDLDPSIRERVSETADTRLAPARSSIVALRSLAPGDAVRARGVLRRRAGGGDGGYRDDAAAWTLEPAEEDGRVFFAAERPRLVPVPLRFVRRAVGSAALGALVFVFFGMIAGGALLAFADAEERAAGASLSNTDAPALAAATPFHREEALESIADALELSDEVSPETGLRRVAVEHLLGDCGGAADLLVRYRRYDESIRVAERCGEPRALYDAASGQFRIGEFARASRLLEDLDPAALSKGSAAARIHTSAARFELAARAARAAADTAGEVAGTLPSNVLAVESARGWQCVAQELSRRAGAGAEGDAGGDCPAPHRGYAVPMDALVPDDLATPSGLKGPGPSVWELERAQADARVAKYAAVLYALAGDEEEALAWADAAAERAGAPTGETQALEEDIDALEEDVRELPDDGANETRKEKLSERLRRLRAARERDEEMRVRYLAREEHLLRAIVLLRAGDDESAAEVFRLLDAEDDYYTSMEGRVLRALAFGEAEGWDLGSELHDISGEAVEAAVAGDVGPLARELAEGDSDHFPGYLPYLAHRATEGRDELLAWYRWGEYEVCYAGCGPVAALQAQAIMRDTARALGDGERTRFWEGAVDRTLALLRDEELGPLLRRIEDL